jgi:hypothetical protein
VLGKRNAQEVVVMALARLNRTAEHTEGAGNCAFNAFALGLCTPQVFSQIERSVEAAKNNMDQRFAGFIRRVSEVLRVERNWVSVKTALLNLSSKEKVKLQSVLAPILRELSISIALNPADDIFHRGQTVVHLMSVFRDYRRKFCGKEAKQTDDVFSRHPFITRKFRKVCQETPDKIDQQKIIDNWWWHEGYPEFLQEMSKDGKWAGDLELARLARYFGVVLDVVRNDLVFNIYGHYGSFPFLHGHVAQQIPEKFKREIIDCLYDRDIIKRDLALAMNDHGIDFNVPEFNIITKRLNKISSFGEVHAFITDNCLNLKGLLVPKWYRNCMDELIQRNVIGRSMHSPDYFFVVDASLALDRIDAIPYYNEVIKICREYYEVHPQLVLQNIQGEHWESTVKLQTCEEAILQRFRMFEPGVAASAMQRAMIDSLRRSDEDVVKKRT